ncbi:MAG: hypothetical protein JKY53_13360 [Flavobacteriales bacterium]|nr:hypothetical protein [Flavobacteriales bacterium]
MNTFKKLSIFSAALLMASSMGIVYAEEGDIVQTRTQDRERAEFNLQTPDSNFGQSRNSGEQMVINKNQNAYQYQYQYKNDGASSGDASMTGRSNDGNMWKGSNSSGSENRMNSANRAMQGSSITGSMNRQSTTSRSMGGRR